MVKTKQEINTNENPRSSARDILHQLYNHLGKPSADKFFPIKLEEVTKSILGWDIEEVSSIGLAMYGDVFSGEPIIGKIDFENKLIKLNVVDTSRGERNYTLAHEIGHMVLHRTLVSCHGGSALRKHSIRNLKYKNSNTANRTFEREADIFAYELLMPEKAVRRQFYNLFERESIRSLSPYVKELHEKGKIERGSRRWRIDQSSPLAVAHFLATYKPEPNMRSLTEFFDVSTKAMSFRLIELKLVY